MLVLTDFHLKKVVANVLDDSIREYIKKAQKTLCVNTNRGVRSYVFLVIRINKSDTIYQTKRLNDNFSVDILFYPTN